MNINLFRQLFVLDQVVWVALAAVKHYKHLRVLLVVDAGIVEADLGVGWSPVVMFSQANSSHQDFCQKHVTNLIGLACFCVLVGHERVGSEVRAKPVRVSVEAGHSGVKPVEADAL